MSTDRNEAYHGTLGHTQQLMRVKSPDFDVIEFSIFRVRQRGAGKRGCSSRIWLMKRFTSGTLVRVRITAEAYAELMTIETDALKLIRCEALWSVGKQRSTSREKPETYRARSAETEAVGAAQ